MKDARNLLGFTFFEVYSSTLKTNARYVEAALQMRYQHLPLGLRLWRYPDKGAKYDKEIDGKLHKVFITCSPELAARRPDARRASDQGQLLSALAFVDNIRVQSISGVEAGCRRC